MVCGENTESHSINISSRVEGVLDAGTAFATIHGCVGGGGMNEHSRAEAAQSHAQDRESGPNYFTGQKTHDFAKG